MSYYRPLSFSDVVETLLTQNEYPTAYAVRLTHDQLLLSAMDERNPNKLVEGIYQLRYYLPEGGSLLLWLGLLTMTSGKTRGVVTLMQREICIGWFLALNNQTALAIEAYQRAQQISLNSGYVTMSNHTAPEPQPSPQMRQLEMDVAIGMMFVAADSDPSPNHLQNGLEIWKRSLRNGFQEQEKRIILALAALQFTAGRVEQSYANAEDAYHFFDNRAMNAEAGLAAFYLAQYYARKEGIDPRRVPASGKTLRWLLEAYERWHAIDLEVGKRLITPFVRRLDLVPPPKRPLRTRNDLRPTASTMN